MDEESLWCWWIPMSEKCGMCDDKEPVKQGDGIKVVKAKYPSAETHLLWVPERHISHDDMLDLRLYEKLLADLFEYGKEYHSDGYQCVINVGKFLSFPQHAHIHLLTHEGYHKPGCVGGICERCTNFERVYRT